MNIFFHEKILKSKNVIYFCILCIRFLPILKKKVLFLNLLITKITNNKLWHSKKFHLAFISSKSNYLFLSYRLLNHTFIGSVNNSLWLGATGEQVKRLPSFSNLQSLNLLDNGRIKQHKWLWILKFNCRKVEKEYPHVIISPNTFLFLYLRTE